MKRIFVFVLLLSLALSACGMLPANKVTEAPGTAEPATTAPAAANATSLPALPGETQTATIPTATEGAPAVVPSGKLPAPSFEAQTYVNEAAGFALEYPAGWTVNEMVVGERGTQVQFLSAPEVAEVPVVPAEATRLTATIYQWEPKSDLPAYIANWKSAWEASGFTVLEEEQLTLDMGLPAVRYTVQTPDATVVYLVTAIGEQYLVLAGEGNLELVKEIAGRVRPIFQ